MNELVRELNNSTITLTFENAQNNGSLSRSNSSNYSLTVMIRYSLSSSSIDQCCCTE